VKKRPIDLASLGSLRGLARLGVAFCVVLTLAVCLRWLFHDALPGQDHWATLNASQTYDERTFPRDEFIGSGRVAEDGRLWMPEHATYTVVVGEKEQNSAWGFAAPHFLEGFLFPRHRVDGAAPWVFCLGCDSPRIQVLSDGGNGVRFGRTR
jgi:hypothetical protein